MTLDLDKTRWTRVAFGEVVRNVNGTVRDPAAAGLDRVIAMEHLDPGELRIARWGDVADGTTFKRRVQPGQTLFGKRRAYQRKAAYAEFGAVCSGDILTFEADGDRLLPEYLPFIVQSDGFYGHALGTSAGSLSPRTNWRDLAKFAFDLPPLDDQERIADLLWALERHRRSLAASEGLIGGAIQDFCRWVYEDAQRRGPQVPVTDLADLRMGRQKAPKYATGRYSTRYLRVANMGTLELVLDDVDEMDFEPGDLAKFRLEVGDVLLTEGDIVSAANVGRAAVFPGATDDVCFQNTLIRARPRHGTRSDFLLALFEGMRLAGAFASAASTTTVAHLGLGRLSALTVPRVGPSDQARYGEALSLMLVSRSKHRAEVSAMDALRSTLLAEVFGGPA